MHAFEALIQELHSNESMGAGLEIVYNLCDHYIQWLMKENLMKSSRNLPRRHVHQTSAEKGLIHVHCGEVWFFQAFPSICTDAFPTFISARIRWTLSAKKRFRDESRCLKVSPPLRSEVDDCVKCCGVVSNERSMRITLATGNEFSEVLKA